MNRLIVLLLLLLVFTGCGSPQKSPTLVPPTPPVPPTTYPDLAGKTYVGFVGTPTVFLEPSTLCASYGLSATTACYQAQVHPCTDTPYSSCVGEWGGGICTGNNGTSPIVISLVFGQSEDQISFFINASVLTTQEGSAPNFSVFGTGTITASNPIQIAGTWDVINPSKACGIVTETWAMVQQ